MERPNLEAMRPAPQKLDALILDAVAKNLEPLSSILSPNLEPLLQRIGDSRIVLLGESTHGTAEFYELRMLITLELIKRKRFNVVALEADWPDAAKVNSYIHVSRPNWDGFDRFPRWMWRNTTFACFVEGLKIHNHTPQNRSVSIHGLDLYSLSASLEAVMTFLESRDPHLAESARQARDCFRPWQSDPTMYGFGVWSSGFKDCETAVLELLQNLVARQANLEIGPDELSALQNARVAANAEAYYKALSKGSIESWNVRDQHMFTTLQDLLERAGTDSKAVVWEHNSHIGDARATEMGTAGELNLGQLCRQAFGSKAYLIGFGTDHGHVAAASRWDGPMEIKLLRPAREDSYEAVMHATGVPAFTLPLRDLEPGAREKLRRTRLERAVGVLYLPHSERSSHYFHAVLPDQLDELIWVDETNAVEPLAIQGQTIH